MVDVALLRRRIRAAEFATGIIGSDDAKLYDPNEIKDLIDEFGYTLQGVLMTSEVDNIDDRLYNETIRRGFLTTSDVMGFLSFSRPGAILAMRRAADLHHDLVFAKRKTRNTSTRRIWVLEHIEHMSTVAVNGIL